MKNEKVTNVKVLYWNHDNDYAFRSGKLIEDSEDLNKINLSVIEDNWTVVSNQDNIEITGKSHKEICETMFSVHNDITSEELVNCLGSKAIFVQEDPKNGNIDHTSMSKADMVVLTQGSEDYYYVCDSWGFKLLAVVPKEEVEYCKGTYNLDGVDVDWRQPMAKDGLLIEPEPKVGLFINESVGSDCHPYQIVGISDTGRTMMVKRLFCKKDPSFKPEWVAGGFAGHCTNQHDQKWFYSTKDEENSFVPVEKIWNSKKGWAKGKMRISERPVRFYDYNF